MAFIDETEGRFQEIEKFVEDHPEFKESYDRCIETLNRIDKNNPEYQCLLFKDWAPYSMGFVFQHKQDQSKILINGGFIFHGNPDESLSVQLVLAKGFAIHT